MVFRDSGNNKNKNKKTGKNGLNKRIGKIVGRCKYRVKSNNMNNFSNLNPTKNYLNVSVCNY